MQYSVKIPKRCAPCCGSSSSSASSKSASGGFIHCCNLSTDTVLLATLGNGGDCSCPSGSFELVWKPSVLGAFVNRWVGNGNFGDCGTITLELFCDDETDTFMISHSVDCGGGSDFVEQVPIDEVVSCNPLELVWHKVTVGGDVLCCDHFSGGYSLTVTEAGNGLALVQWDEEEQLWV